MSASDKTEAIVRPSTKSLNPRLGLPSIATGTKPKTEKLSENNSRTTVSDNVVPSWRHGTNIRRVQSTQCVGTNRLNIHKLGEIPSYLKHKDTKNISLLAKVKREYEEEILKVCDAQNKVISLRQIYRDVQRECSDGKDVPSDALTLLAFRKNNFRIHTKSNLNEENTKSLKDGFYDDIMMLMNEKLSSLKIKKYDDILSDISKILDSDEVFGPVGDGPSQHLTTVRTKLVQILNEKHHIKNEYSHIIDDICDLVKKKNLQLENLVSVGKPGLPEKVEQQLDKLNKEIGQMSQQLVLKNLESESQHKREKDLNDDYHLLETKIELYSNEVKLLCHLHKKTETEKNEKIEELQLLLERATSDKLVIGAEENEAWRKENMELSLNINSLEWTIAEMEEVIERLQLEENNSGSPSNNAAAASAEEIQNLCSTLVFKQLESSRQARVIEELESNYQKAKKQRLQQTELIAKLTKENEQLKVIMSSLSLTETVPSPSHTQEVIPVTSSLTDRASICNTSDTNPLEGEQDEEHAKSDDESIKDESNPNNDEDGDEDGNEDADEDANEDGDFDSDTFSRLSQESMIDKIRKYLQ